MSHDRRVVVRWSLLLLVLSPALAWGVLPAGELWREAILSQHVGFGTVTGGAGGTLCTVTNLNATGAGSLEACARFANNTWVIFSTGLTGTITLGPNTLDTGNNATIDGRGADITIAGRPIWIDGSTNIFLENLKIAGSTGDGIDIRNASSNIWIDHLTFGSRGSGEEQLDIDCVSAPAGIPGVTVSRSRFTDSTGGAILLSSDGTRTCNLNNTITLTRNFYDNCHVRLPLMRFAKVHAFNNYYKNTTTSAGCTGQGTCIAVQARSQSQFNSENDIFECASSLCSYPRVKAINDNAGDGDHNPNNVKVAGQLSVTTQETYEQLNQGTIFNPASSYSYTAATATLALRDAIVAEAGWQPLAAGDALVGWWKLNETSGTTTADASGNTFTGTLTNMESPGDWVPGIIANGLQFDGTNEYITITDNDLLSPVTTGQFSVCAWVRVAAYPVSQAILVGKGTTSNYEYVLRIESSGGATWVLWSLGATDHSVAVSAAAVPLNTWTHVCGTYESAVLTAIYLNGTQSGSSTTFTGTMGNGTSPVNLGRRPDNSFYLNGGLDDVRLFNYALTQPEIALILAEGVDVLYHLDEVASPANDAGQPGLYDGTWQNTPTPVAGKLNGALSFASASSEYVSVATSPSLSGPATIALWVKMTSLAGVNTAVSNYDVAKANTQVGLNVDPDGSWNYLYQTGATTRGFASAAGVITTGVWIHLAATDDGAGTVQLYQAGSPISSTPFGTPTAKPVTAPGPLALGRAGGFTGQYLDGAVDEVHILSRVMSGAEITALAAEGGDAIPPGAPTNLRVVSP